MGQAVEPVAPWSHGSAKLSDARAELREALARADSWRDRLGALVQARHTKMHHGNFLLERAGVGRRIASLEEKCRVATEAITRDRKAVQRLSSRLESAAHLESAERELRQKESQIKKEQEPLHNALRAELDATQEALANTRRVLIAQAIGIFQVVADGSSGLLMSMPLPQFLHSLNREGAQQECTAVTLLARLTNMIASLLGVELPFSLEFRPSHCLIQGQALTPLRSSDMSEEGWMEHYRLSLHMLALNTRHIMLSQLGEVPVGGEREGYAKICATNDISPLRSLRNLLWLASWPSLGHSEEVEADYAWAEHAAFAEAHSSAADQDWAVLLPPRPSESDD